MSELQFSFDDSTMQATLVSYNTQGDTASPDSLPLPMSVIDNTNKKTYTLTTIGENALVGANVPKNIYLSNTINTIILPTFVPNANVMLPVTTGKPLALNFVSANKTLSLSFNGDSGVLNPLQNGLIADSINTLGGGSVARLRGALTNNGTYEISVMDANGNLYLTLSMVAVPPMRPIGPPITPADLVQPTDWTYYFKILMIVAIVIVSLVILYYVAAEMGLFSSKKSEAVASSPRPVYRSTLKRESPRTPRFF